MTQDEAIAILTKQGYNLTGDLKNCTGVAETCPVDECEICSVRECPGNEVLHFHHDGCPYCYNEFHTVVADPANYYDFDGQPLCVTKKGLVLVEIDLPPGTKVEITVMPE